MKRFNNVRLCREFRGYSQKYIAKQLGKSQAAYSKIENGTTHLSDHILEKLSEILLLPKEILYSDTEITMDFTKINYNSSASNGEDIYHDNNNLLHSLIGITTNMFRRISENKKALEQLKLNQKKLQRKLNELTEAKG
jgi:transcriptional regulator with XRE-family HTH domain